MYNGAGWRFSSHHHGGGGGGVQNKSVWRTELGSCKRRTCARARLCLCYVERGKTKLKKTEEARPNQTRPDQTRARHACEAWGVKSAVNSELLQRREQTDRQTACVLFIIA